MPITLTRRQREDGWYINRRGKKKWRCEQDLEEVRIRRANKKFRQREKKRLKKQELEQTDTEGFNKMMEALHKFNDISTSEGELYKNKRPGPINTDCPPGFE